MKILSRILAIYLVSTVLVPAGVQLWTRESYEKAIKDSSVVFHAKVVGQSQQYFHKGEEIVVPDRGELSKYFGAAKELPVVHTKVTLQVTSIKKGDSLKVGQRIEVTWKDSAFVMCPHPENNSLSGKERQWRKVGGTFKILPKTLHKKVGDRYVIDNAEQGGADQPATAPQSKSEGNKNAIQILALEEGQTKLENMAFVDMYSPDYLTQRPILSKWTALKGSTCSLPKKIIHKTKFRSYSQKK